MELDERFSNVVQQYSGLLRLIPSVITNKNGNFAIMDQQIREASQLFEDDVPHPELLKQEIFHWKTFWINNKKELNETAAAAIKVCDKRTFPNIYILLKLICTLPVTSCECERTISVMRRLNNHLRCTMGQDRLSSLALMHIHYEKETDIDKVAQRLCLKQSRRMNFGRIFK